MLTHQRNAAINVGIDRRLTDTQHAPALRGEVMIPLTSYCSRECYYTAQRRQAHSLVESRRLEDGIGGYSWPIPMKGDK